MPDFIDSLHLNYAVITDIIQENSKILDLGCGCGTLLKLLIDKKHCSGLGIDWLRQVLILPSGCV